MELPNAAHLIYIPVTILLGVVIGWVLGSRAAQDACAAELRKRERTESRRQQRTENP